MFPDEFRRAFEENYVLAAHGKWFDVWRCRQPLQPERRSVPALPAADELAVVAEPAFAVARHEVSD